MGTHLNVAALTEFARRGRAAQAAVDALLGKARKCQHCGDTFLPQSHNAKFCTYTCRYLQKEKLKRESK